MLKPLCSIPVWPIWVLERVRVTTKQKKPPNRLLQARCWKLQLKGQRGVLMNITGGADLGLQEVNIAAELIQNSADPEANIIFGAVIDENLKDEILITVIATGFEKNPV